MKLCVACGAELPKPANRSTAYWASRKFCSATCQKSNVARDALFASKVERRGADDCWPWLGATDKNGYGTFGWQGVRHRAHRWALSLSGVPVDPGLLVLHNCDNPRCVNPAHLRQGTAKDNSEDMVARNRQCVRRGSRNTMAKLTEADVLDIRASPVGATELAKAYGVTHGAIILIRNRERWSHV